MIKRILLMLLLAGMIGAPGTARAQSPEVEFRGGNIGINSILTQEDCDRVIAQAEEAGVNAVFVNVYYFGAAYHTDQFPWREGVTEDFDPIGYLLPEMKRRGIAFYAMFVNARITEDLPYYNEDWLIINADGEPEGERINYCNPEVRAHEKAVMLDFARRFPDADGIQFDYIRFPWQEDYPYNPDTRQMYEELTGIDPLDLERNPDMWSEEDHARHFEDWRDWRKQQITKLVREVSRELREIDPDMQLCASVLGQPHWIETACQDWPRWVNEGLIDFAKPMFYHSDDDLYREKLAWYRSMAQNSEYWDRIIPSASGRVRGDDPIVQDGQVLHGGSDQAYVPDPNAPTPPTEEEARAQLVVNKVDVMREAGLHGVNYFTLTSFSDEAVEKLNNEQWSQPARIYVPPPRRDLSDDYPVN